MHAFTPARREYHAVVATQACLPGLAFSSPPVRLNPGVLPTAACAASVGAARRGWQDDEIALLRTRYPDADHPIPRIAALLARTPASVRAKARRLGLRRPKHGAAAPLFALAAPRPVPQPLPPAAPVRASKSYRVTRLGGRESVWDEDRVRRLIRLWAAGFHHAAISEVLGVGARAASTKATRISLPARKGSGLSRDVQAARRLDAAGSDLPKVLRGRRGGALVRKRCNLSGIWFYGPTGVHTCPEAKQTLYYERMLGLN